VVHWAAVICNVHQQEEVLVVAAILVYMYTVSLHCHNKTRLTCRKAAGPCGVGPEKRACHRLCTRQSMTSRLYGAALSHVSRNHSQQPSEVVLAVSAQLCCSHPASHPSLPPSPPPNTHTSIQTMRLRMYFSHEAWALPLLSLDAAHCSLAGRCCKIWPMVQPSKLTSSISEAINQAYLTSTRKRLWSLQGT
jgi:hypothetical protein